MLWSGILMSTRLAAVILILATSSVVSGCAAYKNASLCKQQMVATYPSTSAELKYAIPKASTGGGHAVAEATYKERVVSLVKKPRDVDAPGEVVEKYIDMPAAVECTFD